MSNPPDWLPEALSYNDFGGDYEKFFAAVYGIFDRDFKHSRPYFKGQPLTYNSEIDGGKEVVFWHITSSDYAVTGNRELNIRRCERIGWIKPIVEHLDDKAVKVWKNKRGAQTHILLWLEELDYLIVLRETRRRAALVTAIYVDENHRRRKLREEWERWSENQTPP